MFKKLSLVGLLATTVAGTTAYGMDLKEDAKDSIPQIPVQPSRGVQEEVREGDLKDLGTAFGQVALANPAVQSFLVDIGGMGFLDHYKAKSEASLRHRQEEQENFQKFGYALTNQKINKLMKTGMVLKHNKPFDLSFAQKGISRWDMWQDPSSPAPQMHEIQEGTFTGSGNCFGIYYPLDLSGFMGKKITFTADIKSDNPGPYIEFWTHKDIKSSLHQGQGVWENKSVDYVVQEGDPYRLYIGTAHPATFIVKNLSLKVTTNQ